MADVKCFKLTSGEEVIARTEVTSERYVFDRPMAVVMVPRQDQQGMGIQLMPYVMSNQDGEIHMKFDAILGEIPTIIPELEKEYIRLTSPIEMA